MRRCKDEKMRRCEDEKVVYRPPLLEEPCAQTLSGKNNRCAEPFFYLFARTSKILPQYQRYKELIFPGDVPVTHVFCKRETF